ncbi:MAG: murein biosynthesis integral membrane protein MurJ [Chlamydiales bacterium]|nr:murein biosynthesis integral membrane protein MurJ [Chlamydiales bacterium]
MRDMIQDSSETITLSAKRFFSGTMISRLTGLAREIAMAAAFGTIPAVAAFWMAFRFAHLLRRLFGEGALNAAFIPHFESLRKRDPKKGARFFYDLSTGVTLILLFLILLLEGILGGVLLFKEMSLANRDVISLTMLMLPALVFISLYALNSSLLNCERSYFLPSVAPSFLNLVWIVALAFLWRRAPTEALHYLAMIIVFAFALQWVVTLPRVYRYLANGLGKDWWQQSGFSGREILLIIRPFLLGMIGVAATQINSALDALFARAADAQGPAFLWYAIRIQQLPLALFGVGLTGALLPPISRAIENQNRAQYRHFLNFALKKTLTLMLPASAAILVLGFSGTNLVYGHGAFNSSATRETTLCLWAYGAGLFPMTAVLILAAAFYARKEYRIPTLLSLSTVGLNIALNALFVFVFRMGAISIAVATTLSACLNGALLAAVLYRDGELDLQGLGERLLKVTACSAVAAFSTALLGHILFEDNTWTLLLSHPLAPFSRSLPRQLLIFTTLALSFSGLLFLSASLLGLDDLLPKRKKISLE